MLARGLGTRLYFIAGGVSKQLLASHDELMTYHPSSSDNRDTKVLLITTRGDAPRVHRLLEDATEFGISISRVAQPLPKSGYAEYLLDLLEDRPVVAAPSP